MKNHSYFLTLLAVLFLSLPNVEANPIRVLFIGHDGTGAGQGSHQPGKHFPALKSALGPDAIYFDYVETPEAAFADPDYLSRFDTVLLYANHEKMDPKHWENFLTYLREGGGFVPIHCASWCFQNIPEYEKVVGGRFLSHKTAIFRPRTLRPKHPAVKDVVDLEAWDETYKHKNHNEAGRTVLQVREVGKDDNITEPEPWTWVREEGKGRVFYTASGHDERVWSQPEFHQLLKSGILWSVGEERLARYKAFLEKRTPLTYEPSPFVPNYEKRPKPLPYQDPLSPEDSLTYTQAPVGFELKLFAAEPQIVNPIGLSWDEQGRLWVAETRDYPNERTDVPPGNDSIKILEDTDGDGRADKVSVFAEGLSVPTSLTHWNGGVIVAQAPDMLFLKDTDSDGRADLREVLFTGWGTQDTHAGPSNLRYGHDNWIHGTVGYAGFKGTVGGKEVSFKMGHFRFRPDGSEIEFLHQFNNNTWGLGFNAAGDSFGSTANNNPSFYGGIPATAYPEEKVQTTAKMIADSPKFEPITPNIRQVDAFGAYTSAAGHALATSAQFPESYRDRMAFVAGPTGHLLGQFELVARGAGYRSINRGSLVASADEWFSPVAAEVGPDGHLWIADWYAFIIQHNPTPTVERGGFAATRGAGNAHENPLRDKSHGRIYRLIPQNGADPDASLLTDPTDQNLFAALGNSNLFWRLTAQRLIVEGSRKNLAPQLRNRVRKGGVASVHALWALHGIGEMDHETHQFALLQSDPVLQRNAVRALPETDAGRQLFFDTAVVQAKNPMVRLAAFVKLAAFPSREANARAAATLIQQEENRSDEWLALALRAAGAAERTRAPGKITGPNLLPNPSFEEQKDGKPLHWKERIYSGAADFAHDSTMARTGSHSIRISSEKGADASWFASVQVKPETDYRLTGWIRTQNLLGARGAQMNAHEVQQQPRGSRTNALTRQTPKWTKVETIFSSLNRTELTINSLFGGWGNSTGTAWWDDVALHEVAYEQIEETEKVTQGDAERGRKLFNEHPAGACIRCHQVEGRGEGVIGPALDGIASRKSREYLYESLVDPGATIAEGFQAEISPMPPMGLLLSEQELADVMAYLLTLTK